MLESLPPVDEHPRNSLRLRHAGGLDFRSGVYFDENGDCGVRPSVRLAETRLLDETSKDYLPLAGDPGFREAVARLIGFPDAPTLQAPGGSGALRWLGEFLHQSMPGRTLILTEPTWGNHHKLFGDADVPLASIPWPVSRNGVDIDTVTAAIDSLPGPAVVLLHGCTHNPTGIDPDSEGWKRIGSALADGSHLTVLDYAFTGYGADPVAEFANLATLRAIVPELIAVCSWSKTFGLYRERPGSISVLAESGVAENTRRHLEWVVRGLWSTPPAHGARVVATILEDDELRSTWLEELAAIRTRLETQRGILVDALGNHCPDHDWSAVARGRGIFAWLRLDAEVVNRLADDHGVRVGGTGMVNLSCGGAESLRTLAKALGQTS